MLSNATALGEHAHVRVMQKSLKKLDLTSVWHGGLRIALYLYKAKKEASDIIDCILNSVIDKMEEKRKPNDIIREQGKEPQNLRKMAMSKQRKKAGHCQGYRGERKQAEIKRIWNATDEIKSLLSKHTANNPQTWENRPNPSNKEKG